MPWGSVLRSNYGNVMRAMKSFARTEASILGRAYSTGMREAGYAGVGAMTRGAGTGRIMGAYAAGGFRGVQSAMGNRRMLAYGAGGFVGLSNLFRGNRDRYYDNNWPLVTR